MLEFGGGSVVHSLIGRVCTRLHLCDAAVVHDNKVEQKVNMATASFCTAFLLPLYQKVRLSDPLSLGIFNSCMKQRWSFAVMFVVTKCVILWTVRKI